MLMRLVIASPVYRIVVGETNSTLVSPLMQNARVQVPLDGRRITSSPDSCVYISLSIFAVCEPSARLTTAVSRRGAVARDSPSYSYLFIQKVESGTRAGFISLAHLRGRLLLRGNALCSGIIKSPLSSRSERRVGSAIFTNY